MLVEEGVDIGLCVEGNQVVHLFAGTDETNWEIQFMGDGDDDAAFGGTVEFGEHYSCDAGMLPESARLLCSRIRARGSGHAGRWWRRGRAARRAARRARFSRRFASFFRARPSDSIWCAGGL